MKFAAAALLATVPEENTAILDAYDSSCRHYFPISPKSTQVFHLLVPLELNPFPNPFFPWPMGLIRVGCRDASSKAELSNISPVSYLLYICDAVPQ